MDELEQARQEIDAVDAQLAALFERRMRAVVQVARYKQGPRPAHPRPGPGRAGCCKRRRTGSRTRPCGPITWTMCANRMEVARQYEALLLGPQPGGLPGGWRGRLPTSPCASCSPTPRRSAAPPGTRCSPGSRRGDAARGVVPFENSHAGDVSAVLDLCYRHPELWVVQVYDLPGASEPAGAPRHPPSRRCAMCTAISRPSPRARPF